MQEPRRGLRAQGPQALLPLEGLRVRQVHPDRGEAAGDGRAGGAQEAAGPGGERGPGAAPPLPAGERGGGRGRSEPAGISHGRRGDSGRQPRSSTPEF